MQGGSLLQSGTSSRGPIPIDPNITRDPAGNNWFEPAPATDRDYDGQDDLFLLLRPSETDRGQTRVILLSGEDGGVMGDRWYPGEFAIPQYARPMGLPEDSVLFQMWDERHFFESNGRRWYNLDRSLLGTDPLTLEPLWQIDGTAEVHGDGSGWTEGFIVGAPFRTMDGTEATGVVMYRWSWQDDPRAGELSIRWNRIVETDSGTILAEVDPGIVPVAPLGAGGVAVVASVDSDGDLVGISTDDWTVEWTVPASLVGGPFTELWPALFQWNAGIVAIREEDGVHQAVGVTDNGSVLWNRDLRLHRLDLPGGIDPVTGSSVIATAYARLGPNDTLETGWGMIDLQDGSTRWFQNETTKWSTGWLYLAPYAGDHDHDGLTDFRITVGEDGCTPPDGPVAYCKTVILSGDDGRGLLDLGSMDFEGSPLLSFQTPDVRVERFGTYIGERTGTYRATWHRLALGVVEPATREFTRHKVDDRFIDPTSDHRSWRGLPLDLFGSENRKVISAFSHHGGPRFTAEARLEWATTKVVAVDLYDNEVSWVYETPAPRDIENPPARP